MSDNKYKLYISQKQDPAGIRKDIVDQWSRRPFPSREEVMDRDVPKLRNRTDIWTELVSEQTNYPYDTEQEIYKHSDLRNSYFPSEEPVIFYPIEVITDASGGASNTKINLLGLQGLLFHTLDRIEGFDSSLGFLSVFMPHGLKEYDGDKLQNIAIGIPNEILHWMDGEQLELLGQEINAASHDFVHSHELYIPESSVPEPLMDWNILMQLSPHVAEDIPNIEAKAVLERRIIQDELFARNPGLKDEIIGNVVKYLTSVEKSRRQNTEQEPDKAQYHQRVADSISILYLSHLRPGIKIDDIPDADKWSDRVKNISRQAYKDAEKFGMIPWGDGLATPEEISALHAAAMGETITTAQCLIDAGWENDKRPVYKGHTFSSSFLENLPLSARQSDEVLKKSAPAFTGKYETEERKNRTSLLTVLKAYVPTPKQLFSVIRYIPAFAGKSTVDKAPTEETLMGSLKVLINPKQFVLFVVLAWKLAPYFVDKKEEVGGILGKLDDIVQSRKLAPAIATKLEGTIEQTKLLFIGLTANRDALTAASGQGAAALRNYETILGNFSKAIDSLPQEILQRIGGEAKIEIRSMVADMKQCETQFNEEKQEILQSVIERMKARQALVQSTDGDEPSTNKTPDNNVRIHEVVAIEKKILGRGS